MYNPNSWQIGDKITKVKLDRLEAAAKSGADGAEAAPRIYAPTNDQWVPVGYRSRTPFNSSGNNPATVQSNGVNLGASFKMMEIAQISGRDLVVEFAIFLNVSGETEITNDVTITRCVFTTVSGQNTPFLFNGSPSITIKSGTFGVFRARSDPLGFVVNKGDVFSIITHVSVPAGGVYPLTVVARRGNFEEGAATGGVVTAGPTADLTVNGQAWAAATGSVRMFAPSALLIRPRKSSSVAVFVTDSIGVGTGEDVANSNARWDEGWCTRAVRDKWPHYVSGQSGTSLEKWYINDGRASFRRKSVLSGIYFTHLFCELGVNDFIGGASLATVQQRWWTVWQQLAAYGRPVYQTTITPATVTSTDQWITLANQTVHANAPAVAAGNTWLRDGAPWNTSSTGPAATGSVGASIVRAGNESHPLTGVLEVADAVESSRGSGKWKTLAGSRVVTDAAIASGSTTLNSATAAFVSGDVGRNVRIPGAGSAGGALSTYITAVPNGTTATLAAAAGTTVASGGTAQISPFGVVADGVHPAGTAGPDKGGHELIADHVQPQLEAILGSHSA